MDSLIGYTDKATLYIGVLLRLAVLVSVAMVGCGFEATIRGQCVLEPVCQCDNSCEPDTDTPDPIACPPPQVFTAAGTASVDLGDGECVPTAYVWGAGGGGGEQPGGGGAFARVLLDTPIELRIQVGGGGLPGAAPDGQGGGGAASWVATTERYLGVAGGGGGGGVSAGSPGDLTEGFVSNGQSAVDSPAGGDGGFGATGIGGRGGTSGGGGGGAPGGVAGTGTDGGSGGGSQSSNGTIDAGDGQQPARANEADGAGLGGDAFSAGSAGRVEIRFSPANNR